MRFKIDENLPVQVAALLREVGHDAATVHSQGLTGRPDDEIIGVCREEDRALITLDAGFADIRTYFPNAYPGIVVLRLQQQGREHVVRVCARLVQLLDSEPLTGMLWIVNEHRVRIRG